VEWQAQAIGAFGDEDFVGGGVGFFLRSAGRMRAGLTATAGDVSGLAAFRPELVVTFHLNPYRQRGISPYAGGGATAVFTRERTTEYIVAFVGVEAQPGRSNGWFAEVGFGGGARFSLGIQLRRRSGR
jgi:hypothetical protein